MTLSLTSVAPNVLFYDGGYQFIVTGVFPLGEPLSLYIGNTDTNADAVCYSGIPGNGNFCYALNANLLVAYSPILAANLNRYDLLVVSPSTSESQVFTSAFTVRHPQFYSSVFEFRAVFPPTWYTGPRRLQDVPTT